VPSLSAPRSIRDVCHRVRFGLACHDVHTWSAGLDVPPETAARLYATLGPDERNRSARFQFERDRQRFIVAHGALRDLLGRYLHTEPGQVRFVYNAFGKPGLSPDLGDRLEFNLSHSGGLALIAIARANVGVDLEYIREESDDKDIALRFFSPSEIDHLSSLSSQLYCEGFFSCWTKKEAYVKARGEGFAIPLNSFSVPLTTDPAQIVVGSDDWSLYSLRPAPGYAGALAIEGSGWRLRQRQWKMA
jgi:4'-phosphopantetheinyl transferase